MIGQDVIPGYDPMPDRLMTSHEAARWAEAKALIREVSDKVIALKLLTVNLAIAEQFGRSKGIDPFKTAGLNPLATAARYVKLKTDLQRIRIAVRQVDDLALAVDFRPDGDIDIVDPKAQLKGDMGAVLLIAAGVVVVGGLIAALYYYKTEADEIRPKYNNLLAATDKVFCDPASPQTCKEWKALKQEKGYTPRATLANQIFDTVGEPVKTGLQLGTAAVIAFLALIVALRFGGSKK